VLFVIIIMSSAACESVMKMPFNVSDLLSSDNELPKGLISIQNDAIDNNSVVSDDSISVSSDDDMDDRPGKVETLGKALQKKIMKGCIKGVETTSSMGWQTKVKQMMIKFVRMFLYDYHPDSYSYIRAILLDCKGIIEDYNLDEQKEFLTKGLKLIKEKSLKENIPFCGAGGFEY
jgi:hypothetical protein